MNNLLPTLNTLEERYPEIISSTFCLFCNKEKETLDHLVLCSSLSNTWSRIIEQVLTHTKEKIKKILNIDFLTEPLKYLLQEHRLLQHNTTNVVTAMIRGFTPKFLELYIKKSKIKGTNRVYSTLRNIIDILQEGFHKYIWLPRCNRWKLQQEKEGRKIKAEILNRVKHGNNNRHKAKITDSNLEEYEYFDWDACQSIMPNERLPKGEDHRINYSYNIGINEKKEWGRDLGNVVIQNKIEMGRLEEHTKGWIYNKSKDVLKYNKKNLKCA